MSEIKLRPCPMCGKDVAKIKNAHNLENCANFEPEDCPCEHYEDTGDLHGHTDFVNVREAHGKPDLERK